MADRGILVVVSGFSGAGKGTLMKRLMEKYDNYALSVSATTRDPRPGEEHGREYFFHTKKEFEELILEDALICLLYTSPSPRDRQKSRMPSSA